MFLNIAIPSNKGFTELQNFVRKVCIAAIQKCLEKTRLVIKHLHMDFSLDINSTNNNYVRALCLFVVILLTRERKILLT